MGHEVTIDAISHTVRGSPRLSRSMFIIILVFGADEQTPAITNLYVPVPKRTNKAFTPSLETGCQLDTGSHGNTCLSLGRGLCQQQAHPSHMPKTGIPSHTPVGARTLRHPISEDSLAQNNCLSWMPLSPVCQEGGLSQTGSSPLGPDKPPLRTGLRNDRPHLHSLHFRGKTGVTGWVWNKHS